MQPYFLPYLGYFDLANMADLWIVYDVSQYIRHGWMNRNRVLHHTAGWQYILVPLKKHPHSTPINKVEIASAVDWKTRIFRQLEHYHTDAPYFAQVIDFLEEGSAESGNNLARLNTRLFRMACKQLGIETSICVFSEMNLPVDQARTTEDLALALCRAVGAEEYINRPGGAGQFDEKRFAENGVKLTIQSFTNMTYACGRFRFEPDLSILDVMMWNSPEEIKHYLDTFRSY